jgi:hypothetical protein
MMTVTNSLVSMPMMAPDGELGIPAPPERAQPSRPTISRVAASSERQRSQGRRQGRFRRRGGGDRLHAGAGKNRRQVRQARRGWRRAADQGAARRGVAQEVSKGAARQAERDVARQGRAAHREEQGVRPARRAVQVGRAAAGQLPAARADRRDALLRSHADGDGDARQRESDRESGAHAADHCVGGARARTTLRR